jgi:hypothetical protein
MSESQFVVEVREYDRITEGHPQHVRRHKRRPRRWYRRPKPPTL